MPPMLAPRDLARALHPLHPLLVRGLCVSRLPASPVVAPAHALMGREDMPAWLLEEIDVERNRRAVRFWWMLTCVLVAACGAGIVVHLSVVPELTLLILATCTLMCARWNT